MKAFNKLPNDLKSLDYCNKTIKCKLRDSPAISHNIKMYMMLNLEKFY